MRLLILSDLHHEVWRERAPVPDIALCRPDVVILAGDIDQGAKAVQWAVTNFHGIPVLYVHGNHEGYGKNLDDAQDDIEAACQAADNVHFLNSTEFVMGSTRFLGTTLWTDFRLFGDDTRMAAMREAEAVMTDYKRIRLAKHGYRKLRAGDTATFHSQQKAWLKRKLEEPFEGKTVVVSHMAPSMQSVPAEYQDDMVSAAYASRLDELVTCADFGYMGTCIRLATIMWTAAVLCAIPAGI